MKTEEACGVWIVDKPVGPTSQQRGRAGAEGAQDAARWARRDAGSDGVWSARAARRRGDEARALSHRARQGVRGAGEVRRRDRFARCGRARHRSRGRAGVARLGARAPFERGWRIDGRAARRGDRRRTRAPRADAAAVLRHPSQPGVRSKIGRAARAADDLAPPDADAPPAPSTLAPRPTEVRALTVLTAERGRAEHAAALGPLRAPHNLELLVHVGKGYYVQSLARDLRARRRARSPLRPAARRERPVHARRGGVPRRNPRRAGARAPRGRRARARGLDPHGGRRRASEAGARPRLRRLRRRAGNRARGLARRARRPRGARRAERRRLRGRARVPPGRAAEPPSARRTDLPGLRAGARVGYAVAGQRGPFQGPPSRRERLRRTALWRRGAWGSARRGTTTR